MKKIIVSMAAVLIAAGSVFAQPPLPPKDWAPVGTPVERWGRLRVTGTNLQSTKTNSTVQLKGMSFGWTSDLDAYEGPRPFYNEEVVAWLAVDWRVSVVRAAVGVSDKRPGDGPHSVPGNPYIASPAAHKNMVHTIVRSAIWQGIYVIIDWHSHQAHVTSGAYPQGERPAAIEFFREMAEMYKDYPNVFYEIYNEPLCSDCWPQIKSYSEPVIDAIRAVDPLGIIIVGTPFYSQQIDRAASSPITGTNRGNLMYSLHTYCNHQDNNSHGHAPFTSTTTIPIFVSESGLSQASGDSWCGSGPAGGAHWYDKYDARNVSWVNWQIINRRESAAAIAYSADAAVRLRRSRGNWADADLTESGRFIRNRLRGSNAPANRTFSVSVTASGPGTVSGGGSNIAVCGSANVTATPANGSRFEGWIINGATSMTNPLPLQACYDRSGEAVFVQDNVLTNSTFTTEVTPWAGANTGATSPALTRTDNGELRVTMPSNAGTAPNAVRVEQSRLSVTQGREYTLTFKARAASGTRTITPAFRGNNALGTFVVGDPIQITATMQTFTARFTAAATVSGANGAILAFYCGGTPGDWFLDDVTLVGGNVSSVLPQTAAAKPFKASFNGHALALSGGGKVADITVYDVSGRVRMSQKVSLSNAGTQVSLSRLPAGVYTVRYKVDGKAMGTNEKIVLAR